jgi:hypothetical protein
VAIRNAAGRVATREWRAAFRCSWLATNSQHCIAPKFRAKALTSCPPLTFPFSLFVSLLLSAVFLSGLRFTRRIKKQASTFLGDWELEFARAEKEFGLQEKAGQK